MNHRLAEILAYILTLGFLGVGTYALLSGDGLAGISSLLFAGWSWLMAERMGEGGT